MAKHDARFVGIDSVVFGAPDLSVPRKLFADWGLKKVKDAKSGLVFATEIGSEVVVRPDGSKSLPPKLSGGAEFREVVWGVRSAKDTRRAGRRAGARSRCQRGQGRHDPCGRRLRRQFRHPGVAPRQGADALDLAAERARRARPGRRAEPDVRARAAVPHGPHRLRRARRARRREFLRQAAGLPPVGPLCRRRRRVPALCRARRPSQPVSAEAAGRQDRSASRRVRGARHPRGVRRRHAFLGPGWETAVGPGRHPISSAYFWYFKNPLGGTIEYFSNPDFVTEAWKPSNFRVNRFSEWHLLEGLQRPRPSANRPSLRAVRAMN